MITFGDMAKELNRSTIYLSGLQKRFDLPAFEGAAYSPAYVAFLRSIIAFRTFDIPEEILRDLWHLEKKLLHLLHVDSTGSRTWFLDFCGVAQHSERRLLLTNYDLLQHPAHPKIFFNDHRLHVEPGGRLAHKSGTLFHGKFGKRAHRRESFTPMVRRCGCIHTGADGKSLSNCRRSFGDRSLCNCFTRSSVMCVLPK